MARAASRIYVPLDVSFFDDDKIAQAGESAGWLYLNMLTKVKQLDTDGLLSRLQVERLAVKGWQRRLVTLLEVGAIEETLPGTYYVPAWLKWNESSGARAERLASDRKRKAEKGGRQ